MNLSHLDEIANLQLGLVERSQVPTDVSTHQLRYLIKAGYLLPVRKNVWRMAGSPKSWKQAIAAVSLSFRGHAVVSHRAAARIWGLPGFENEPRLEVSFRRIHYARRLDDVICHQLAIDDFVAIERGCIWVTPLYRTLLDLAAVVSPQVLADTVDFAVNRKHVYPLELERKFEERAARGRDGTASLRLLLHSIVGDKTRSDLERTARSWIRSCPSLPEPVGQHRVAHEGSFYDLDLAYPRLKVAVEPAGYRYHGGRAAFDHDARRTAALVAMGWRVIPMTSRTDRRTFQRELKAVLAIAAVSPP